MAPPQNKHIPLFKVFMSKNVDKPLLDILHSGYIGQGPKVDEFELELRKVFNQQFITTVNSCTSGLTLAIHMLKKSVLIGEYPILTSNWPGIKEDDEVLTCPLTCTATNWPIINENLKVKWVDIDPNTCNIDLDDLARKITKKTKIIMLVHWGGYPVNLDKVKQIQEHAKNVVGFKPAVIEDCAHAFGSYYKGKPIGSHGNISCFSFQAIKHLTTGDGGVIVWPHQELYKRAKLLRWYGIDREDKARADFRCEEDIPEVGWKYHMNDIAATIGLANLPHMKELVDKHRDNAAFYRRELSGIDGIKLFEEKPGFDSAYWLFTLKVKDRDNFMKAMKDKGIMVSRVHERNDKNTCVRHFKSLLPNLDQLSKEMVCIPVGWWVDHEDQEYIVDCVRQGW